MRNIPLTVNKETLEDYDEEVTIEGYDNDKPIEEDNDKEKEPTREKKKKKKTKTKAVPLDCSMRQFVLLQQEVLAVLPCMVQAWRPASTLHRWPDN
jgi:hypothetical protein